MKALAALVLIAAVAGGGWAYRKERDHRRHDVARLEGQVQAMQRDLRGTKRDNEALAVRLRSVTRGVRKAQLARTTLAARVRASVFTVSASLDEGSGFVGWVRGKSSYVVTANHVVALSVHHKDFIVRVHRGTKVWLGRIFRTDPDNDLA